MSVGFLNRYRNNFIIIFFPFQVQSLEDLSVPDDLEDLTQSSDTDDVDSHASGYRNAASFMQKLESFALGNKLAQYMRSYLLFLLFVAK